MDILISIVSIIFIIVFFKRIVQGIICALIFGFIGSLFGQTGAKIGAIIGFIAGISSSLDVDEKKKEIDKEYSKTPEEPKKDNKEDKLDNSKIVRCPYCKKKIRIRAPRKKGKCPACSEIFSIKEDDRGNMKAEKEGSTHKKSHSSKHASTEDYYKILGVSSTATLDEVRAAYKKKIREYHPDRVTRLGDKLKKMAGEESKQINKAYSELKAKGLAK